MGLSWVESKELHSFDWWYHCYSAVWETREKAMRKLQGTGKSGRVSKPGKMLPMRATVRAWPSLSRKPSGTPGTRRANQRTPREEGASWETDFSKDLVSKRSLLPWEKKNNEQNHIGQDFFGISAETIKEEKKMCNFFSKIQGTYSKTLQKCRD